MSPEASKAKSKAKARTKANAAPTSTASEVQLLSQSELANLPLVLDTALDSATRPPQFVRLTAQPDAAMIAKLLALPDLQSLISSVLTSLPPELCALPRLQVLHLDNSPITSLPDEIGNLTQLRFLNLGYCTSLHELPEGIAGCVNLFRLDVRSSGLQRFPAALGQLKKLKLVQMYGLSLPASAVTTLAPKAKVQQ